MTGSSRASALVGLVGILLVVPGTLPQPLRAAQPTELVVVDATAPPTARDPFKEYGTQSQSLFRLVFGALIDRSPDGKIVTPFLESWGPTGDLTWEFILHKSVRFASGEEVSANDVAFSLGRILDPSSKSPRRADFETIDRVEPVDRYRVRIVTKRPYPLLPARLSQFSMILPEAAFRARGEGAFFENPIGPGPYRIVTMTREEAVLDANPYYFGGRPKVPRVLFRFIADPKERLHLLLEGKTDIVTNLLPHQVDAIMKAKGVRLLKRNSNRFFSILLDTSSGPLADLSVRRAIRRATDVDSLIKYVAHGNGHPIATVTLPVDFGFTPDVKPATFDPGEARALLSRTKTPKPLHLRALITQEADVLAQAVAQQWGKVGVELTRTVLPRSAAIRRWITERSADDLFIVDPTSIIFDASYQMRVHLDPEHPMSRIPRHGRAMDLLNRADVERDPKTRIALLRQVQSIFYEEVLGIPLYQVVDLYGVRDRVRGFVASADTILRLADVTLGP